MTEHPSLRTSPAPYPQEQRLDQETILRWRREAITAAAQDRLWLNRCEALCNALIKAKAKLDEYDKHVAEFTNGA